MAKISIQLFLCFTIAKNQFIVFKLFYYIPYLHFFLKQNPVVNLGHFVWAVGSYRGKALKGDQ